MSLPNIRLRKLWLEKRDEIFGKTDLESASPSIQVSIAGEVLASLRTLGFSYNVSEKAVSIVKMLVSRIISEMLREIGKVGEG